GLAVLARPGVGGDRLAPMLGQLPVVTQSVHERRREALLGRVARLPAHDEAEHPMLAAKPLEGQDLFVDPARLRRRRGADHNLGSRLLQCAYQRVTEAGRCSEFVPVAEHGREAFGHRAELRLTPDKTLGYTVGL